MINQYPDVRTLESRNSPTGPCPSHKLPDHKILHVTITVRLWGKNETSNSQSQLDGVPYRPTIHGRGHPKNNTHGNMAEEGNVTKKARLETSDEAKDAAMVTESSVVVSTSMNPNSLHGETNPHHGKKRSASELINQEKTVPSLKDPLPQQEETGDAEPLPNDSSDDKCLPGTDSDENAPLPQLCP